jgi:hypothetical protein
MAITAEGIVASIASSEHVFRRSPEKYSGFVRHVTKTRVDFHWARAKPGKPDEMTVNQHGVVCSRTLLKDGRTWFGYTLDPFGDDVPHSAACEAAEAILDRFIRHRAFWKQLESGEWRNRSANID